MEQIKYFHQPTISESLGNGWYTMKRYFLWLFLAIIISGIFNGGMKYTFPGNNFKNGDWSMSGGPFSFDLANHPSFTIWIMLAALAGLAIFILIRPVITFGAKMMFVQGARDLQPDIKWLFKGFRDNYLNIVLTHILKFAIIAMGFVALVIPGIILACRLVFAPYLVMDKALDPIRAIEESWRLTRGYGWTIFGLALMSIPIFILGLLCLFIGVFPAIIWVKSSFASLYQSLLTHKETPFEHESIYAK